MKQLYDMSQETKIIWRGMGRWLSLAGAALLIAEAMIGLWIALDRVHATALEAAAGWNLCLGLVLVGAVTSGSRRVPILARIVAILMFVRVVLGVLTGRPLVDVLMDGGLVLLIGMAAIDLRRQARADI